MKTSDLRLRQQGFTLVETLIAMVILMSLIFTANYTYSFYTRYWSGKLGQFDQSLFTARGLLQLKQAVESAIPYVVRGEGDDVGFYFLGRDEGFTLVSASPIFGSTEHSSSVIRVFREQENGHYQVVYEEAPLSRELLVDLEQELTFTNRLVLFKTEQPISFDYYGWPNRNARYSQTTDANKRLWRAIYDGAKTDIQPLAIRMHIGEQSAIFRLSEGHEKLINFYLEGNL